VKRRSPDLYVRRVRAVGREGGPQLCPRVGQIITGTPA